MSDYNEQYYIMEMPYGDDQIYLKPDRKTADRDYECKKLLPGGAPLFFVNFCRDKHKNRWPLTDVFVDDSGLLLVDDVRDKLRQYDVKHMQIYPAVYIDDEDNWHENYWYLGFYDELDCWDRQQSVIDSDPDISVGPDFDAEVEKFSLDEKVLDAIEEEKRLIFKMGGTSKAYLFAHQKIVDIFVKNNYTGIRFMKVSTFEEGDQFSP